MRKVFRITLGPLYLMKHPARRVGLARTLPVQAVWQQAVGVPQCQMRFGSNEKVTIIMVAGPRYSIQLLFSLDYPAWGNLGLAC